MDRALDSRSQCLDSDSYCELCAEVSGKKNVQKCRENISFDSASAYQEVMGA